MVPPEKWDEHLGRNICILAPSLLTRVTRAEHLRMPCGFSSEQNLFSIDFPNGGS